MIERVAKDGKFSEKEAKSVMTCLSCQQSLFGYLIVMDCLFLSMFLPLLVEDTLVWEGDNNGDGVQQHNDNGVASDISHSDISLLTWNIIKILYEINVSFVFFSCCVHVMICGLFLGLSSYLMDAKSVLWMLVHCHSNFVFINNTMFPIFVGVIMTGMLGTVLRLGVVRAIPAIIFATLAIVLSISYYNKIIRPLFFLLGTTGDGTWIANEEVDETLGRNTKKVLKKLLKSNNRNYSRSSMINVFDRIAAGSDGADGNANANANGEGGLDIDALRNGIGKTSVMLTDYEMKALFQAVDKDGDGVITRDEWEEMVNEEADYNASKDFLVE
jgi:Ca2+-binding EF-hand superfamily protein